MSQIVSVGSAATSVGAFGASPNANGAVLSNNVLIMEPADSSNPGGVSAVAQTVVGKKTFSSGSVNASVFANATNGGSLTPDCNAGNSFSYTAGAGVASFTVNAPTNPDTGQRIVFIVGNVSGGVLAVTWNAVFHLATWVSPATGAIASIEYWYSGSAWIETNRSLVTVPA